MKTLCLVLTLLTALLPREGFAAPKSKRPETTNTPGVIEPPSVPDRPNAGVVAGNVIEFQGDDLSLAIRTLARQAQMNVVVAADVSGEITLRVEGKKPKEVIEVIANMKDLVMEQKHDIYYIRSRNPKPAAAVEKAKSNDFNEATLNSIQPIVTKFLDMLLDYEARPETAQKIAKSKKALLDALVAEGFTRDEAFKLLLAEPGLSFFGTRR